MIFKKGVRYVIQLQNVEKGYNGESVLRGVNLTVNDGEYLSVMGRSGSGKSTLPMPTAFCK